MAERVQRQPQRLRRTRRKGYRMPARARYVGRPTKFGNPFTVAEVLAAGLADTVEEAQAICAIAFEQWLDGTLIVPALAERRQRLLDDLDELEGLDLICWCALGSPCHVDPILIRANRPRVPA